MINPYKIKKWSAMLIAAIIPSLFFMVIMAFNGFFVALGALLAGALISLMIGNVLLRNPFSDLLEGKGLLTFNLTSTGILQPFIMPFSKNFIKGYLNGEEVEEFFDRDSVIMMSRPKQTGSRVQKTKDGGLVFEISGEDLNESRFAFNQYPVLFYNSISQTMFTKEQLADLEKNIISYNKLTFLTKKVEDLSMSVKNFARHIVDNLRPKAGVGGIPTWVIIMLVVIIIGVLVYMMFQGGAGGALGGAFSSASQALPGSGAPISPAG